MQNSPCWFYSGLVGLLGALLAFVLASYLSGDITAPFPDSSFLDDDQFGLFVDYDRNLDGHIDMEEFVPLANKMLQERVGIY